MKISTFTDAYQSALETAGYTWSDQIFTLEETPSSIADKSYCFDVSAPAFTENSGGRLEKVKDIIFYFAFYITQRGDRKAKMATILDYQESLEDLFYTAITTVPVQIISANREPLHGDDYAVVSITAQIRYWRDI